MYVRKCECCGFTDDMDRGVRWIRVGWADSDHARDACSRSCALDAVNALYGPRDLNERVTRGADA